MKNVTKTIEVNLDMDELKDEVTSALEEFVLDCLTSDSPKSLHSYLEGYFETVQEEVQQTVDLFMENDTGLDVDQYLDKPGDDISVSATYEKDVNSFSVEIDVDMEERMEDTDFHRLLTVLNDLGLNVADKTAILKIAKDAGVE